MKNDHVLSMLSIAAKSGNVASGEYSVENAVKSNKAFLAIISTQASGNTKKKFRNMCEFYNVPYYEYAGKEELGHSIGKEFRACACVLDSGLAEAIMKRLNEEKLNNGGKN